MLKQRIDQTGEVVDPRDRLRVLEPRQSRPRRRTRTEPATSPSTYAQHSGRRLLLELVPERVAPNAAVRSSAVVRRPAARRLAPATPCRRCPPRIVTTSSHRSGVAGTTTISVIATRRATTATREQASDQRSRTARPDDGEPHDAEGGGEHAAPRRASRGDWPPEPTGMATPRRAGHRRAACSKGSPRTRDGVVVEEVRASRPPPRRPRPRASVPAGPASCPSSGPSSGRPTSARTGGGRRPARSPRASSSRCLVHHRAADRHRRRRDRLLEEGRPCPWHRGVGARAGGDPPGRTRSQPGEERVETIGGRAGVGGDDVDGRSTDQRAHGSQQLVPRAVV